MNNDELEEKTRNLQMRKTWIEDEITEISNRYGLRNEGEAFLAFAVAQLFDLDYEALLPMVNPEN